MKLLIILLILISLQYISLEITELIRWDYGYENPLLEVRKEKIDNILENLPPLKNSGSNIEEICSSMKEKGQSNEFTESEYAYMIFKWLSTSNNIEFDCSKEKESAQYYSNSFTETVKLFDLESDTINGYYKNEHYLLGSKFESINHYWNIIIIEGKRYIIDVSLGSGYCDPNTKSFIKEFNEFYFCSCPEQIIYTHFPKESENQLINDPIKLQDFIELPKITSHYFNFGFLQLVFEPSIYLKSGIVYSKGIGLIVLEVDNIFKGLTARGEIYECINSTSDSNECEYEKLDNQDFITISRNIIDYQFYSDNSKKRLIKIFIGKIKESEKDENEFISFYEVLSFFTLNDFETKTKSFFPYYTNEWVRYQLTLVSDFPFILEKIHPFCFYDRNKNFDKLWVKMNNDYFVEIIKSYEDDFGKMFCDDIYIFGESGSNITIGYIDKNDEFKELLIYKTEQSDNLNNDINFPEYFGGLNGLSNKLISPHKKELIIGEKYEFAIRCFDDVDIFIYDGAKKTKMIKNIDGIYKAELVVSDEDIIILYQRSGLSDTWPLYQFSGIESDK